MKICLLNDSFPPVIDGVVNAVLNYASVLNHDGHDVMVGTPWYPDTDYSIYPYKVVTYPSLNTSMLTGGYRAGYPFPVEEMAKMASFQPEIIHTHCPISSAFIARSLRDTLGAPVILTWHTKYDMDVHNSIHDPLIAAESIKAIVHNASACDEVWAVSHGAGENLKSLGYEGDVRVMLNGVDFEKGRSAEAEIEEACRDYDLPADIPVFLFVGRLVNYKGLPLLIDAFRILAKTNDFRMVFIGKGTDRDSLISKIKEYGFSCDVREENGDITSHPGSSENGRFIFTGPIRDRNILRAWNTRADLFLFPSTFDTNGLVVREAAACALASMLIGGSCAAEGIEDGRNGYLIKENAEAAAEFLQYACSHTEELHQAGMHAQDEIYLSWNDAVHTAEKAYAEIHEKAEAGLYLRDRNLFDDPLYEMSSDAIMRYLNERSKTQPQFSGMLDNLQATHDSIAAFLQERIDQVTDSLPDDLKRILKLY
ncbi:MAG: glycosyltransferase [Solobacterium sp.]|nr:glycosyltransferase [Solobacterium sp.]